MKYEYQVMKYTTKKLYTLTNKKMNKINIAIIWNVKIPERWHEDDSWIDLFVPNDFEWVVLNPWENVVIPLWIKTIIQKWYDATLVNRSSLASKQSLVVWACLIDSWYRWEIMVDVHNIWDSWKMITAWQKIVQMVVRPVILDEPNIIWIDKYNKYETERGTGWFGSTDV